MRVAPRLLVRTLDRARADWLDGDPDAWARYTAGLARLEQHLVETREHRRPAHRLTNDRPSARA